MTYADFQSLCEQRHSIRTFENTPVTKEEILQLLELARHAPSVDNLQPWHFHVIFNKDQRKELMDACCYGNFVEGAGVMIVVTADLGAEIKTKKTLWNPKELEYSCITAMEHIWLGATAMGLGGSWVSLHHGKPHEVLGLPHEEVVIGGMMLGHPKRGEASAQKERKPLGEIYTFHE
ncbi:MAG: nitroreductase [Candidatus Peregrinibacteria bacterium Greene0416_62]|nr:MAG: nitroreductase [Candidatus Peregrinibacteria bacterium Greene0416_62]TSC98775.1 MAG: nitroreductase [Candidatus Peregrinibacteria bacterium Greene1014_49]